LWYSFGPKTLRPCRYLGDISYSTYLSHPLAGRIMLHADIAPLGNIPYLLVVFPLIYAMSATLYAVVEVPAKRWLRRTLDARLQPATMLPQPLSGGSDRP
jgi:peptidoglycan/LPS O-acetylase OafA/YrhL